MSLVLALPASSTPLRVAWLASHFNSFNGNGLIDLILSRLGFALATPHSTYVWLGVDATSHPTPFSVYTAASTPSSGLASSFRLPAIFYCLELPLLSLSRNLSRILIALLTSTPRFHKFTSSVGRPHDQRWAHLSHPGSSPISRYRHTASSLPSPSLKRRPFSASLSILDSLDVILRTTQITAKAFSLTQGICSIIHQVLPLQMLGP